MERNKARRYIAQIREVEVLADDQAESAVAAFRANGRLDEMTREIREVGGIEAALGAAEWAAHILNVRFRLENVDRFPVGTYAQPDDPICKRNRYQLYGVSGDTQYCPPDDIQN